MSSIPPDLECIQAADPTALTHCLHLPTLQVTQLAFLRALGWLLIYARPTAPTACCPRCGHASAQVHQYHTRLVRDLAWADLRCYLHLTRRRFKCATCARPFTEPLTALAPPARTTTRYAAHLLAAVRTSTIAAVARAERHGYKAIEGSVYRQAAAAHPPGPPAHLITRLGIDEIAARKGHGHYQLVVVDLDRHQVVDQLAARDKATVQGYFAQWSAEARAALEEVATDFWATYHEVAADLLPGARVVGDRFHVQQHVNDALNTIRREVQRQMDPDDRAWVQARRHLLLRNDEDLDGVEQLELEILKAYQPEFDVAHTLKERLRTIYETAPDRANAATQLDEWLAAVAVSGLAALIAVGEFIGRWREPILNYFVRRTTSGLVEGLNNKIKLVKRRAFGFRNDAHFRLRVLLACDGAA
jgi:transposase